jgi:hypothetical protein
MVEGCKTMLNKLLTVLTRSNINLFDLASTCYITEYTQLCVVFIILRNKIENLIERILSIF